MLVMFDNTFHIKFYIHSNMNGEKNGITRTVQEVKPRPMEQEHNDNIRQYTNFEPRKHNSNTHRDEWIGTIFFFTFDVIKQLKTIKRKNDNNKDMK